MKFSLVLALLVGLFSVVAHAEDTRIFVKNSRGAFQVLDDACGLKIRSWRVKSGDVRLEVESKHCYKYEFKENRGFENQYGSLEDGGNVDEGYKYERVGSASWISLTKSGAAADHLTVKFYNWEGTESYIRLVPESGYSF
jgi:hypothetical protein